VLFDAIRIGKVVPDSFFAFFRNCLRALLRFSGNRLPLRALGGAVISSFWGSGMVGRGYLSRQAMALLSFARATANPQLAAALVEKAASLKSQADEIAPSPDASPRPPDVEINPPARTN
jgi:hypothetical protein